MADPSSAADGEDHRVLQNRHRLLGTAARDIDRIVGMTWLEFV